MDEVIFEHVVRVTGPATVEAVQRVMQELSRAGCYWSPVAIRVHPAGAHDLLEAASKWTHYDPDTGVGPAVRGTGTIRRLMGFSIETSTAHTDAWEVVWESRA